ncbi:ATP-binding cassette domain-containing protein [Dolosigranulum pigrum]|uniref:cysteine peptidase family C39 domain-containing protein n=1 Tax=Dolosigranulum pigrum TaxID=29394 RepID=UPI001AD874E5|nr:cysteine peptidase family C39 domain-containing protein [Dolosigranulum pigrum]QTJ49851.1 ATP-binding cassette domain-containing protein [Dolosigranulum pigrum]
MKYVPEIIQFNQNDCGPCCLSMLLNYYGYESDIEELTELKSAIYGWSMLDIKRIGEKFGLESNVYNVQTIQPLKQVKLPAILFWEHSHFVVLEKIIADEIIIVNPSVGRQTVNKKVFWEKFTGYIMEVSLGQSFQKKKIPWYDKVQLYMNKDIWNFKIKWQYVALLIVYSALLFISPLAVSEVISSVGLDHIPYGKIMALVGVVIATGITNYLLDKRRQREKLDLEESSTLKLYNEISKKSKVEFSKYHSGDTLSRLHVNSDICQFITIGIPNMLLSIGLFMVVTIYLLIRVGMMSLILSGVILLIALINGLFIVPLMKMAQTESYKFSDFRTVLSDGIISHNYFINSGIGGTYTEKVTHSLKDYLNVSYDRSKIEAKSNTVQQMTSTFFSLILSVLGMGLILIFPNDRSNISLLMTTGMILYSPAMSVLSTVLTVSRVAPHMKRLNEMIKNNQQNYTTKRLKDGSIKVKDLTFQYENTADPIINDRSFRLNHGEKLVICGESGSGKTTLIDLLLGLNKQYDKGEVVVGGVNTKEYDLNLKEDVCYITQPTKLFKGTLKDNLKLYLDHYDVEQLIEITADMELDTLGRECDLSNHLILEDGLNFSQGQKQRLGLLRLFLGKYKIIIVDEPTSNLDDRLARKIFSMIDELNTTKIIITHDEKYIQQADKVLNLGDDEHEYQV